MDSRAKKYYGAFLDLSDHACLVVGAGMVAERKVKALLRSGAKVTVVSPAATPWFHECHEKGQLVWHARPYVPTDVEGVTIVFAATDSRVVNRKVYADATAVHAFVNVADDAQLCTLTVPAVVHKSCLQVAISTLGQSPTMAKKLREALEYDLIHGTRTFQETIQRFEENGG